MPADPVIEPASDPRDRPLELGIREGAHAPARVTDEVVVMLAAGQGRLIARGAGADVEPLDQAEPLEQLERAIDGCDSHSLVAEAVGDVSGREHAVLLAQQLDHARTDPGGTVARLANAPLGVLGPGGRGGFAGCSLRSHPAQTIAVLSSDSGGQAKVSLTYSRLP
jgi:hypothetical protein